MENTEEELKERVKRLRSEAGLSQVALANLAGLSVKMIKDIENGRRGGSVSTMQALARSFEIPLEDLVGKENPEAKKVSVFNTRKMIKAMGNIPDEVYELALKVGPDNNAWEFVKQTLAAAAEIEDDTRMKSKKSAQA